MGRKSSQIPTALLLELRYVKEAFVPKSSRVVAVGPLFLFSAGEAYSDNP